MREDSIPEGGTGLPEVTQLVSEIAGTKTWVSGFSLHYFFNQILFGLSDSTPVTLHKIEKISMGKSSSGSLSN